MRFLRNCRKILLENVRGQTLIAVRPGYLVAGPVSHVGCGLWVFSGLLPDFIAAENMEVVNINVAYTCSVS